MAPVGCQPQGPACRQPTANTSPVVHLSQRKLVPTLLLGGQGYMCVDNLPKVVTRYASARDRTRRPSDRESRALTIEPPRHKWSHDPKRCCEAVRSAILATAWFLVYLFTLLPFMVNKASCVNKQQAYAWESHMRYI